MRKKDLLTYTLIAGMSVIGGVASFLLQNKNEAIVITTPKVSINQNPIGSLISNLSLTDTQQQQFSLHDYKTDYVLINFWATWCPPCRREMPILKKLDTENDNLTVLGFSYDSDEAIIKFKDKIDIDYPLFQSSTQSTKLNALFGNKTGGLPYTVLLDKKHKIIMVHSGEITEKQIMSYLN